MQMSLEEPKSLRMYRQQSERVHRAPTGWEYQESTMRRLLAQLEYEVLQRYALHILVAHEQMA
jgi:hypothetical protein